MKEFLTSDPVMCLFSCLGLGFWLWAWTLSRRKKTSTFDWITLASTILRIFCGLLLVEASLDKLGDAARFSQSLANYKIVPSLWLPLLSVIIPWIEFFTGVCLVIGLKWRGASLLFCLLMGVYAFALSFALLRGIELNCSCFNSDSKDVETWLTVVRDLLFLSIGGLVLLSPKTHAEVESLNGQLKAS